MLEVYLAQSREKKSLLSGTWCDYKNFQTELKLYKTGKSNFKAKIFSAVQSLVRSDAVESLLCHLAPSAGWTTHLLPVVSDRRQDGAKSLEAHSDVQQMSGEEEVVEVSKDGHGGVPDQIQEGLQGQRATH